MKNVAQSLAILYYTITRDAKKETAVVKSFIRGIDDTIENGYELNSTVSLEVDNLITDFEILREAQKRCYFFYIFSIEENSVQVNISFTLEGRFAFNNSYYAIICYNNKVLDSVELVVPSIMKASDIIQYAKHKNAMFGLFSSAETIIDKVQKDEYIAYIYRFGVVVEIVTMIDMCEHYIPGKSITLVLDSSDLSKEEILHEAEKLHPWFQVFFK